MSEMESESSQPDRLTEALRKLTEANPKKRQSAARNIQQMARNGLSVPEVTTIIRLITADLTTRDNEWLSVERDLWSVILNNMTEEQISPLREQYPKLSSMGGSMALTALARLQSREATRAYVRLLQENGWPFTSAPAMTLPYQESCRFADELLPAFVDGSIAGIPERVWLALLLAYAGADALPYDVAAKAQALAIPRTRQLLDQVAPLQQAEGIGWRWSETYEEFRTDAGMLLDLLGYLSTEPAILTILRRAERFQDPYLRLYALLSLLRHQETPEAETLQAVAVDSETRGNLFSLLSFRKQLDLFPPDQLQQEKLAESDMVQWLIYPTELGMAPDHIELMRTVELYSGPEDGGEFVYYIFRFKMDLPHWAAKDGWMAGVSGPFRKQDFPTTASWGDTFSAFTKWEEFEPEEHLSSITDLMQRWREAHAKG